MPDNLKKKGPADRKRVSLMQKHEREYWTKRFNCTLRELIMARQLAQDDNATEIKLVLKDTDEILKQNYSS